MLIRNGGHVIVLYEEKKVSFYFLENVETSLHPRKTEKHHTMHFLAIFGLDFKLNDVWSVIIWVGSENGHFRGPKSVFIELLL